MLALAGARDCKARRSSKQSILLTRDASLSRFPEFFMQTLFSPSSGVKAQRTGAPVTRVRSRITHRAWLTAVAIAGLMCAGCASVPHASNDCVGPVSFCNLYQGS
jgi:hypothetical protein